jgi:chromosome partitioning protein
MGKRAVRIVGCVSQKGGVAKSSLARLVARDYAARGQRVLLADLDTFQATALDWSHRRQAAGLQPAVPVIAAESVKQAIKAGRRAEADLLVLDGRGFSDRQTLEIAEAARALLLPTGLSVDDLKPSVRLAHELTATGFPAARLTFALCRAEEGVEAEEARLYLTEAGYACLGPVFPERAGFRRAHDEGRAATEARHPQLRSRATGFAAALLAFIDSTEDKRRD